MKRPVGFGDPGHTPLDVLFLRFKSVPFGLFDVVRGIGEDQMHGFRGQTPEKLYRVNEIELPLPGVEVEGVADIGGGRSLFVLFFQLFDQLPHLFLRVNPVIVHWMTGGREFAATVPPSNGLSAYSY